METPHIRPRIGRVRGNLAAILAGALFVCQYADPASAQDRWVSLGPDGAAVAAVAVNPTNPLIVYAGLPGIGVQRSADGGNSWADVSSGLANPNARSLAIDPVTPSTLYAATDGGEVFRTTNAGETWSAVTNGLTTYPSSGDLNTRYSIVIDPATPFTLYYNDSSRAGIYRTTDRGDHWSRVDTGLPAGRAGTIYDLKIDPLAPHTLYAGSRGRVFRTPAVAPSVEVRHSLAR